MLTYSLLKNQYVYDVYDDTHDLAMDGDLEVGQVKHVSGNLCYIHLERIGSPDASNGDYETMAARVAQDADALLFVYDGNDPERGLREIRELRRAAVAPMVAQQLPAVLAQPLPTVVAAAKADIAGDDWEEGLAEGRTLAGELNARFCVVSSIWGDGVKDAIDQLVAEVLGRRGVEVKLIV